MSVVVVTTAAAAASAAASSAARRHRLEKETEGANKDGCATILQAPPKEKEVATQAYTSCAATYPTYAYDHQDHTVANNVALGCFALVCVFFVFILART